MNSAIWKWLVGLFYFSPGSLWLADAARTLVALKTAVDPGSTHCSSRISISAQLHICSELPLAWEAKAPTAQQVFIYLLPCSVAQVSRLSGPLTSTSILLKEIPRARALPGTGNLNHESHTSRTKGIFIFLCTTVTFFWGGAGKCHLWNRYQELWHFAHLVWCQSPYSA